MRCLKCGREVKYDDNDEYIHEDGRVKHPVEAVSNDEEDKVAPRTRVVDPTGEEYAPILDNDNPEQASLAEQAQTIFEDEDVHVELGDQVPVALPTDEEKEEQPVTPPPLNLNFGKPKEEDMVVVRGGGKYLTARRRIVWLRGEPVAHPDWTIDTYAEEIERGKYVSNTKVAEGYARYRANVFDAEGRLIGTGTKTEWSERFMDFAEKAETGAIARALAVCGYGTEAALDLDEGVDDDRIADAPVSDSRPINIGGSNVQGLVQGGRSTQVTQAQLNEIQRLIKVSAMGMTLVPFMENVLETSVPELGDDPTATIMTFLKGLSFDEAATLIGALNKAVADAD